jgi:hypothetical protein
VHLEWTPQRRVWIGLAVSGLALLLCLAIVALTRPVSRRRREAATFSTPDEQPGPELEWPDHRRPTVVTVVAVTVAFAVAGGPAVGLAAGAVTAVGALWRPGRWLVAFGGALALAAAGAYVALQQLRYRYPPDFAWPVNTERAHDLGWLAVALVVASVLAVRPTNRSRTEESLNSRHRPQ